ncbi:MAG TPA: SLC13 family permease [Symbiobacteriaceae bacterium]|nr:SLC13 family permease [Symbiobacteriaceae bacterium]
MVRLEPECIPLLAGLPRLTFVRLLPELELLEFGPQYEVAPPSHDRVYILYRGQLEWMCTEGDVSVPVQVLSPGDLILDGWEDEAFERGIYKCLTPVVLVKMSRARLETLLEQHPDISKWVQAQLLNRLDHTRSELARTRRLLDNYARELWGHIPEQEVAGAAFAVSPQEVGEQPISGPAATKHKKESARPWWRDRWFAPISGLVLAAGWFALFSQQSHPALYLLCVFLWAGLNWAFGALPDHVVALTAAFACVVLGLSSLETAFGGFASESWWLLFTVLGLVVVVTRTGLLYRLALAMLRFLPPTYGWQAVALALAGLVMTPCVPNVNARMSILGPLTAELADAMRLPAKSRGAAGLAMAAYLGASQVYFLFLNGAPMTLLLWSILAPSVKSQVNWGLWLLSALPMAAIVSGGFALWIWLFFRPDSARPVARSMVTMQQAILGPLTRQEWMVLGVLAFLLVGFISEPWHGIPSSRLAIASFLFLTGGGLLDKEGLKHIDWSLIIYMGAVISLSAVAQKVGLNQALTSMIAPWVKQLHLTPLILLLGVALLTIVLRLAVPGPVATVVLTVALEPVARAMHISPFAVGLVVVAFCSSWLVPQQWSVYLNLYNTTGERCFTHKQVHPLAWANNILLILGLILSMPLWQWLGLVP